MSRTKLYGSGRNTMKKRRITAALLAIGSALGISGCGDEQHDPYSSGSDMTYAAVYGPPSYFGMEDEPERIEEQSEAEDDIEYEIIESEEESKEPE